MGQAKQRGTYEQRVKQAVAAGRKKTPERISYKHIPTSLALGVLIGLLGRVRRGTKNVL